MSASTSFSWMTKRSASVSNRYSSALAPCKTGTSLKGSSSSSAGGGTAAGALEGEPSSAAGGAATGTGSTYLSASRSLSDARSCERWNFFHSQHQTEQDHLPSRRHTGEGSPRRACWSRCRQTTASVRVPYGSVPYLAADKLPQVTVVTAQISPGKGCVAIKRSEAKLESLVNEEDALVVG